MELSKTNLNDGKGNLYPVRVIRHEGNYYLSAEEVAEGLKFEGTGIRNVKDWLRNSSKEISCPSIISKGVFYMPKVFVDAFQKKHSKIKKDYPESFNPVVLWIQSDEGFGKDDFIKMLSELDFEPIENSVQNHSGSDLSEEEVEVEEIETPEMYLLRMRLEEEIDEQKRSVEAKKRQEEAEERIRLDKMEAIRKEEEQIEAERKEERRIQYAKEEAIRKEEEREKEEVRKKEKERKAKQDQREDIIDENRNRLKIFFTNPIILFIPLFAAIIASGVDMSLVFMKFFDSDFASIALSVVFSSIILIFTFNSEGRGGKFFVFLFALIEAAVNAVYFGLIPSGYEETVVQICATVGLPLALVAYAGLFTKFTKTEKSI